MQGTAGNISVTSDISAQQNPTFQVTGKLQVSNNDAETYIQMVETFADKLVNLHLAEWQLITLQDGRKGFALFFDRDVWDQDKLKKSLHLKNGEAVEK